MSVPSYAETALRNFLTCSLPGEGFARAVCRRCGRTLVIGFSCQHRCPCPSCAAKKMAVAGAKLVDDVIPEVPVRMWTLTLPKRLRFFREDPFFGGCDLPTHPVVIIGYLLCFGPLSGGTCAEGNLYDEVDIDRDPISCRSSLVWEIIDFGEYTLLIDGSDPIYITKWRSKRQDLVVDSHEPYSNTYECQVMMTVGPWGGR